MTSAQEEFLRARRPEQIEARRSRILATAEAMLRERPVAEISLRELSNRVGLAKSNVLRYFDSREAIFLEVLDQTWKRWLDEIGDELPKAPKASGPHGAEISVASAIAASLMRQPLLCELISAMAGVLERNISVGYARQFKQRASANTQRLAALVRAQLPQLSTEGADHFAGAVFVITAGLWPYAHPAPAVLQVMEEMGVADPAVMFTAGLTDGLVNQLIGVSVRGGAPAPTGWPWPR